MSSPGSTGRAELSVCQPGQPSGKQQAHTQRGPWRVGLGRGLFTKAWQVGYPKGGVVPGLVMGAGSTPQAWGVCQGVGSGSGDGGYPGSRSQLFGTLQEGAGAGLPGGVSVNKACSWGAAPPSCSPARQPQALVCVARFAQGFWGSNGCSATSDGPSDSLPGPASPPRAFSSMTPPSLPTPIFALCSLPTPQTLCLWWHSYLLGYL